jgi:hypothetical protein
MKTKISRDELFTALKTKSNALVLPEVDTYYDKLVRINRKGGAKRDIFVYPKFGTEAKTVTTHFLSIFSSLQKLTKYIVFEDPSLLKLIKFPDVDIEGLKRRPLETLISYCRIDGVRSNNTFKFFEINTRKPQMFEDSDWLSRYVLQSYELKETVAEDSAQNISELINDYYVINTKKRPETILFIPNELKAQYSFSLYIQMIKQFKDANLLILNLKELYDGIEIKSKELFFKGLKVDLIVTQGKNLISGKNSFYTITGNIRNNYIREAFNSGNVEIFTSPASIFSGAKLLLSLLQDKEIQTKIRLNKDEIDILEISLPHSFKGSKIDPSKIKKDDYVIKKGRGMGLGIYLGSSMTQEAWDALLGHLIANKKRFVLQERIYFEIYEVFNLQTQKIDSAYTTLEPIIVNNPLKNESPYISGYSSRGILEVNYDINMKFNPATNNTDILYGSYIEEDFS